MQRSFSSRSRHRRHHGPPARLHGRRARSATAATASSAIADEGDGPGSGGPESGSASTISGVVPSDLMTFAKGVTSGYVPLGGVAINDAIYSTFTDRAYPGGLTYSGHPLACAAAVATINAMEDEGMVANAARIGEQVLGPGLRAGSPASPRSARFVASACSGTIELVSNPETREPLAPYGASSPAMNDVLAAAKSRGLRRSPTSTAFTPARRATSPMPRSRRAWPFSTRPWTWRTATS